MAEMRKPKVDLKELASNQVTKTIKIVDKDGKTTDQTVSITMTEPDVETKLAINDLSNVGNDRGDYGELVAQALQNVLVSPRLDFKAMDEAIESDDSKAKRVITFKGKDDKNHKVTVVYPGYREALNLINDAGGLSGASHITDYFRSANKSVYRDSKGNPIDFNFWKNAKNMYDVFGDTMNYLNEVMNTNGYNQIIGELISFLSD